MDPALEKQIHLFEELLSESRYVSSMDPANAIQVEQDVHLENCATAEGRQRLGCRRARQMEQAARDEAAAESAIADRIAAWGPLPELRE